MYTTGRLLAVFIAATVLVLSACGDDEVLTRWQTEVPERVGSTVEVVATDTTLLLPRLPAGQDPLAPESYWTEAIRSLAALRGQLTAVDLLIGSFLPDDAVWQASVRESLAAMVAVAEYFRSLNPPQEFVEQDALLSESMARIVALAADLEAALNAGDVERVADVVAALQGEANVLSTNGEFPAMVRRSVPTTLP